MEPLNRERRGWQGHGHTLIVTLRNLAAGIPFIGESLVRTLEIGVRLKIPVDLKGGCDNIWPSLRKEVVQKK
jgi:hypothetical protein